MRKMMLRAITVKRLVTGNKLLEAHEEENR
jgi:hypothetical protein